MTNKLFELPQDKPCTLGKETTNNSQVFYTNINSIIKYYHLSDIKLNDVIDLTQDELLDRQFRIDFIKTFENVEKDLNKIIVKYNTLYSSDIEILNLKKSFSTSFNNEEKQKVISNWNQIENKLNEIIPFEICIRPTSKQTSFYSKNNVFFLNAVTYNEIGNEKIFVNISDTNIRGLSNKEITFDNSLDICKINNVTIRLI